MIAFVKKANNWHNAVPQRDSFNIAMNAIMNTDGSFDLDYMIRNYTKEFSTLISLVNYQLTKNRSHISPPSICIEATKKYETLFADLEMPVFQAIKRALASEDYLTALTDYKAKMFFLSRAVLSDLPDRLKEKAISIAKSVHGDDFDTTDLANDVTKLETILSTGMKELFFFDMNAFELIPMKYVNK